jgi:hypothetical protein
MSRNLRTRSRSTITPHQPDSRHGQRVGRQWEQMVTELLASCDNQPPESGTMDEVAIARCLSGGCSSEERAEIERTIARSPELSECVALAREALGKTEAAA